MSDGTGLVRIWQCENVILTAPDKVEFIDPVLVTVDPEVAVAIVALKFQTQEELAA